VAVGSSAPARGGSFVAIACSDGEYFDLGAHGTHSTEQSDRRRGIAAPVKESSRRLVQACIGMDWSFNARRYLCFV
jgi:hypothetical protein